MRYTYVQRDGQGRWLPSATSCTRARTSNSPHVRVYAPAATARVERHPGTQRVPGLVPHAHGVTDVWGTSRQLEEDFADQPLVSDVERAYATERGPMSDGISVIHVASVLLAVSVPAVRRRVTAAADEVGLATPTRRRSAALFGFALAVPLVVRGAGIGLEQALPWLPPKLLAAPLYVVPSPGSRRRLPAERARSDRAGRRPRGDGVPSPASRWTPWPWT